MTRAIAALLLFLTCVGGGWSAEGAEKPKAKPAELSVTGLSWLRNRELRLSLERLLGDERGETIGAGAIEDAALILLSALGDEGYQKPVLKAEVTRPDGSKENFTIDARLETTVPRTVEARAVRFTLEPGVRSYVEKVEFTGLHALSEENARGFFRPEAELIAGKAARAYSPGRLRRGVESLQEELHQRGYAEAQVQAADIRLDETTGAVSLRIEVNEGTRWEVSSVKLEGDTPEGVAVGSLEQWVGRSWSPRLQQDLAQQIRQAYLGSGYPDASVRIEPKIGTVVGDRKPVALTARVTPGFRVTVGRVRFEGVGHTRKSVLESRVHTRPGDPLNPLALERARYRIARLGVFDEVDLHYEPADGEVRDPVFVLREGRRWDSSLLLGYGSYEQLRGGVEFRQMNVWGRAHQTRLQLVQSMKSSRGEYTYNVPELFGESLDGTAKLFGLQREERAFLRTEYGGSLTLKRPLPWINADATVSYTYQALRNEDNELATRRSDDKQVRVASVDVGLARDRRDNPLRPRRGYRWFAQTELAAQELGSEVNYQRFEFGGSYHIPWGQGRWIHLGLTHGVITTLGTTDALLPVNKRFYPGGDSSIRGYAEGEASPRDGGGRFIGAKTYLLANVELEQALTANWSAVVFGDALGAAARLQDYPFDEELFSVGLGIRYQTLIGPIRLEYARNVNPRTEDPNGTLHISVGFPF